ncbi:MAG TPA: hypothetical protein VLA92_03900 [Candidatus Saccharimonadales bacterium]|nr:hypothetical protein [Candidatus Saccharimonadales bacterium]
MPLSKRSFSVITNRPYWYMYVAGVVLLLLSGYLWWNKVYLSPERAFWGMVSNSLSTSGVTIETEQSADQSKLKQIVQMELGATNRAHSLTTLTQGQTEVKTEIIGTKDADYTRYRSIKTDQKNAQGKALDVSKVENVWSKSDDTQQTDTQASGHQLLAQAVLGIGLPVGSVPVPIGDVSAGKREDLVRQIKSQNVYETSFKAKDVVKEKKDGRTQYTYTVKIQTILYVRLMKEFAKDLGMKELDSVDPNTYQTTAPLNVKLTVDPVSRQLVAIDTGQGYKQTYAGYGLPLKVEIPKKPITAEELQKRLSEL